MAENQQPSIATLVAEAREQLNQELRAHAEQIEKIEQGLQELRGRHQQLEGAIQRQLETLEKFQPPVPAPSPAEGGDLEKVLGSVRNLITATLPEQVLEVLTEEAQQMGVRAAVFDIRGKAAWGSAARGFGPELSEKTFRALVVPLTQDNPFRQAYETGGHVDATVDLLKKNRNVLDKFKPKPNEPILLLPVRSAGSVSAILYADPGGRGNDLPVNGLKILSEFAGAQLDRLMALSGGLPSVEAEEEVVETEPVVAEEAGETAPVVEEAQVQEQVVAVPEAPAPVTPVVETHVVAAPPPPPPQVPVTPQPAAATAAPAAGFDISQLSESEQKVHKDAMRFAKLLVSEIDLYNKAKVQDGRKNKDIYRRLRSDIDRSRQTYDKRFGKTLGKEFNYFYDEVVRILAANDPSLLGSDYPGTSA